MKLSLIVCFVVCVGLVLGDPHTPSWGGSPSYTVRVKMTDPADSPDNPNWYFNYSYFVDPKEFVFLFILLF